MVDRTVSPTVIDFASEPSGAKVVLDDGQTCTTPCSIRFTEVTTQQAAASLPDGRSDARELQRRLAYSIWGNFVVGVAGLALVGIDWWSGALWTYEESSVRFDLNNADDAAAKGGGQSQADQTKAAAAADTAEDAGSAEPDPLSPEAMPRTPAVLRVMTAFPEGYLTTEVRYYYGGQSRLDERRAVARIYRILLRMQEAGERLDVDEAIRQDSFEHPAAVSGKAAEPERQ